MKVTQKEIADDLFLTVTRKDFQGKPSYRRRTRYPFQWKNPIAQGFKLYLKVDGSEDEQDELAEDVDSYIIKAREKYKKTGERYFQEPINRKPILKEQLFDRNTLYRIDYCNAEKKLDDVEEVYNLPEGWVIPETITKKSYRDPRLFDKTCFSKPQSTMKVKDCIRRNEETMRILKVKTGNSEYNDRYGILGEMIIKMKLYGKMNRPKVNI